MNLNNSNSEHLTEEQQAKIDAAKIRLAELITELIELSHLCDIIEDFIQLIPCGICVHILKIKCSLFSEIFLILFILSFES